MKILYVGPTAKNSTCEHRLNAMRRLGHEMVVVNTVTGGMDLSRQVERLANIVDYHVCNWRLDPYRVNKRLYCELEKEHRYDVVWLDKALMVRSRTLKAIKRRWPDAVIASYSPDDQLNPANHSFIYLRSLPLYDVCFTTKSYNVRELKDLNAKHVVYVGNGFDPRVHRPTRLTEEERTTYGCDVCFVGTYEKPRAQCLERVAELPYGLKVWGNDWDKLEHRSRLRGAVQNHAVYGEEYAKRIVASSINLNFLKKANRDLVTTRSVEIPACGGFMLAERTAEHQALFEEGVEAEFFGGVEEMVEKIHYYMQHKDERRAIARRGRLRCLRSRYSNDERVKEMLDLVKALPQRLLGA